MYGTMSGFGHFWMGFCNLSTKEFEDRCRIMMGRNQCGEMVARELCDNLCVRPHHSDSSHQDQPSLKWWSDHEIQLLCHAQRLSIRYHNLQIPHAPTIPPPHNRPLLLLKLSKNQRILGLETSFQNPQHHKPDLQKFQPPDLSQEQSKFPSVGHYVPLMVPFPAVYLPLHHVRHHQITQSLQYSKPNNMSPKSDLLQFQDPHQNLYPRLRQREK